MKKEEQDYLNYFNNGKPNWNRFIDAFIRTAIFCKLFYIGYKFIMY
jgi:hypothetical protein